jgi:hypothetical protein
MIMTLKIKDKLFRYVPLGGIHEFLVVEVHETQYGKQYIVEDQSCNHGWKCRLLITKTNEDSFKFIRQINDDEDNPQEALHKNLWDKEYFFHTSKIYALLDIHKKNVSYLSNIVIEAKDNLKKLENDLAKNTDILNATIDAIKELKQKAK